MMIMGAVSTFQKATRVHVILSSNLVPMVQMIDNNFDPEIGQVLDSMRASSVAESDCLVDIENGVYEVKVHLGKVGRDCRICHLTLEMDGRNQESGIAIELGCSCKNDLAAAHKYCAETWFKIKGNKTCEICNSIARNVVGGLNDIESAQQTSETNAMATNAVSAQCHQL